MGNAMPYVSQGDVHAVVRALREAGLNRLSQGTLWRWLLLKERGLGPGATVTFTSDYCRDFALRWTVVNASAGGNRTSFQPFTARWSTWESASTKWWLNSFYSQLKREAGPAWSHPRETEQGVWETTGDESSAYLSGLRDAFESRVPLASLAIWRYRADELSEDTDEPALVQRLINEVQLEAAELDAVFTDHDLDVDPFEPEA